MLLLPWALEMWLVVETTQVKEREVMAVQFGNLNRIRPFSLVKKSIKKERYFVAPNSRNWWHNGHKAGFAALNNNPNILNEFFLEPIAVKRCLYQIKWIFSNSARNYILKCMNQLYCAVQPYCQSFNVKYLHSIYISIEVPIPNSLCRCWGFWGTCLIKSEYLSFFLWFSN